MSMMNFQGSWICLQRGYGFSFTPKQPFRSKIWCDPFEFILFRAHFWLYIVMSIFPHCSARLWSCWHDDFDGLQMATSMTLRSTLYNFRNLQASYGTADITPSLYPGASFSIILLHGVPRSSIFICSRKSDRQSKTVRCALVTLPQAKEECGRDAELYLDTNHWQREG